MVTKFHSSICSSLPRTEAPRKHPPSWCSALASCPNERFIHSSASLPASMLGVILGSEMLFHVWSTEQSHCPSYHTRGEIRELSLFIASYWWVWCIDKNKWEFPIHVLNSLTMYILHGDNTSPFSFLKRKWPSRRYSFFALKNLYFSHCLSTNALFLFSKGKTLPFKGMLIQGRVSHLWMNVIVQSRDSLVEAYSKPSIPWGI